MRSMSSSGLLPRCGAALALAAALCGLSAPAAAAVRAAAVSVVETPVEVQILVTASSSSSFNSALYTVPAGQMLIVDTVTVVSSSISSSPAVTGVFVNRDASSNLQSLVAVTAPAGTPAAVTQPVHLHVQSGGQLAVNLFMASGNISSYVSFSGHLVDAP